MRGRAGGRAIPGCRGLLTRPGAAPQPRLRPGPPPLSSTEASTVAVTAACHPPATTRRPAPAGRYPPDSTRLPPAGQHPRSPALGASVPLSLAARFLPPPRARSELTPQRAAAHLHSVVAVTCPSECFLGIESSLELSCPLCVPTHVPSQRPAPPSHHQEAADPEGGRAGRAAARDPQTVGSGRPGQRPRTPARTLSSHRGRERSGRPTWLGWQQPMGEAATGTWRGGSRLGTGLSRGLLLVS